jgi:hypothetical protein
MLSLHLPPLLADILESVIVRRIPSLLPLLRSESPIDLSEQQAIELSQALTDELCESGLKVNSEPNRRGNMIEELIDIVLRSRRGAG